MKKLQLLTNILLVIFLFNTVSSCTSTTMITSEPSDAKVFLNNAYVGNTPFSMTDNKLATECTIVEIKKPGYKPLHTIICKDEKINTGAAIGGIFIWPLWFWVYDYYPEHNYLLEKENSGNLSQNSNNQQMEFTVDDQAPEQQIPEQTSKAKKLQDIKKLYDDGILTKKEYEKEKEKILETEEW